MKNFHCNNGFFSQHQWFLLGLTLLTPVVVASLSSLNSRLVISAVLFACWIISHCSDHMNKVFSPGFGAVTMFFFFLPYIEKHPADPVSLSLLWKLALRTVNSSHSAYSCFLFSPLFFQRYKLGIEQSSETIKCKLSTKVHQTFSFSSHSHTAATDKMNVVLILSKMHLFVCKSVLPLFRCLTSIERSVEQCQISVSSTLTDRVMIQFFCRHGNGSRCWRCITNPHHLVAAFPNCPVFVRFLWQASLKPTTCVSRKVRPCRLCLPLISPPTCWSVLPG